MNTTCSKNQGLLRLRTLHQGMAGLLMATALMSLTPGARADVFGGGAVVKEGQQAPLLDRIAALERELKELKAQKATGGDVGAKAAATKAKAKLRPLPGFESLPGGGRDERERLLVEKELKIEVVGTINDMLIIRDGDKRLVLTDAELKEFEKAKRDRVIKRFKEEAVSEGDTARVTFPELIPPPPPPVDGTLSQAAGVVDQAKAIEANGGQLPSPPPKVKPLAPNGAAPAAKKN